MFDDFVDDIDTFNTHVTVALHVELSKKNKFSKIYNNISIIYLRCQFYLIAIFDRKTVKMPKLIKSVLTSMGTFVIFEYTTCQTTYQYCDDTTEI